MKVLLITHKPDIDGVTPVILSKIAFTNLDYVLVEIYETNPLIKEYIENRVLHQYDIVYITDLSINLDVCEMIDNDPELKKKVKIFDHHNSHLFVNDFSFGTAISVDENGDMQSGTSLYYQHLLNTYDVPALKKEAIKEFVDLVRQFDTWEWFNKYHNDKAKKLNDFFDIFGGEYFIKYYYDFLISNETFYFADKDEHLLVVESKRIERYIEEKATQIIPVKLLDYNVGMVFAESHRSELGNTLARKYEQEYDFIIIINMSRGISYRGIKEIDLGHIASYFGGKGHINSSGSPIPADLKKMVIEYIFSSYVKIEETKEVSPNLLDKIQKI